MPFTVNGIVYNHCDALTADTTGIGAVARLPLAAALPSMAGLNVYGGNGIVLCNPGSNPPVLYENPGSGKWAGGLEVDPSGNYYAHFGAALTGGLASEYVADLYYDVVGSDPGDQTNRAALYNGTNAVAAWWLDEASGTLYDATGNGRNMQRVTGTPVYRQAAQCGSGVSFPAGAARGLALATLGISGGWTILGWLNLATLAGISRTIGQHDYSEANWIGQTNTRLRFSAHSESGSYIDIVWTPHFGSWVHVVQTYDETTHRVYINAGVPAAKTYSATPNLNRFALGGTAWYHNGDLAPNNAGGIVIGEASVFSGVLLADQVTAHKRSSELANWWTFTPQAPPAAGRGKLVRRHRGFMAPGVMGC